LKNIALIYSGDSSGLNSLQDNKDSVQNRLHTTGIWQTDIKKTLKSQKDLIDDLKNYKDKKIDRLLLYYTGHGVHTGTERTFCLQLPNSLKLNIQTVIDCITDTFDDNDSTRPQTIAIVLDACYSGKAIENIISIEGIEVLTSSLAHQRSFEDNPHSDMSLFSHFFCEAIEELPNENEIVTLQHISTYINGNVDRQKSLFSMVSKGGVAMQIAPYIEEETIVDVKHIFVAFAPIHDKYKVSINHQNLFDGKYIDIFNYKTKIIEEIKTYMEYMTPTTVELILPQELYCEDIALWEDDEGHRLINSCNIITRSYSKTNQSKLNRKKSKDRWDTCYSKYKDHSLDSASVCTICEVGMDTDKISTIIEEKAESSKSTFYGIDKFYFIAFWINDCDDIQRYKDFMSSIISKPLNSIPEIIRGKITPQLSYCSSHIHFMWDDPNTLPKAHHEQN